MDRRTALGLLAATPLAGCRTAPPEPSTKDTRIVTDDLVLSTFPLGFQWKTEDPFLFCVHHDDAYPAGNAALGPATSLAGRPIGNDFEAREGWRMYHGDTVPGFPEHPHRGFETITVVRRGLVDHSDSLGAAARYGDGDVQWLTAGKGIVHAEMFPLLDAKGPNPLELFQIWMNLPATDKLVAPHFSMLWNAKIPRYASLDSSGRSTEVTVVAGRVGPVVAGAPPPKSWAARSDTDVAIWTLKLAPEARFVVRATAASTRRTLYFFRGRDMKVGGRSISARTGVVVRADVDATIDNGASESEILMLQGRPIQEPVVQRGPFVMNTSAEIEKAYSDYRATGFGGWPWPKSDPVHARGERFARHVDGRMERGG